MFNGRPGALGLLLLVGLVTACSGGSEPVGDTAVASYHPPAGAPSFCTTLANSTGIVGLPAAVGALAADTGTVEARLALTAAIHDLRAVLDGVRALNGYEELDTAIERSIATFTAARDERPLSDAVLTSIGSDLDDVGRLAQPVCDFSR